jgi:hypothetical protein
MPQGARHHAYAPLSEYLSQQAAQQVVLTFPAIEAILGMQLPQAAWTRHFWSNRRAPAQKPQAWCRVGWQVTAVDLAATLPTVTFVWAPLAASSWQPLPDA